MKGSIHSAHKGKMAEQVELGYSEQGMNPVRTQGKISGQHDHDFSKQGELWR